MSGFSFGGIVSGLLAARAGARVRTLVLIGSGGMALPSVPTRPLVRVRPGMSESEVRDVYRVNLRVLMLGDESAADDLAVFLQIENVRRARFKSGDVPASDALLQALPGVKARIAGIWGSRDAFVTPYVEDRRRVLARSQPDLEFHVIEGAAGPSRLAAEHQA